MLGEKLRGALDRLQNARVLDKDTIKEAIKEMQRALIAGDVEVSLVLQLSKKIEEFAFSETLKGVSRREHIIKLAYDGLTELLGGQTARIPESPQRILLVGLFGSGKTTTAGKLAHYYSKRGKKVGLLAADTYRPAAVEQLKQIADKGKTPFYGEAKEKHAATVVRNGMKQFSEQNVIICDSAGRSALDEELVDEIKDIHAVFKPDQVWLVLNADMGQLAKKQAHAFHTSVGVDGVIITKTDGSGKGGGALAACHITKSPVLFIGTGEKLDDLQEFDAQRYLSRIMGYGDLQSLLEKVKQINEDEETELSPEELLQGEFNLDVFYKQLQATKKMGPLGKVAEMMGMKMEIPKEQLDMTEEKLDSFKFIMDSMTPHEKKDPEIMNSSRMKRIAAGSGTTEGDVRELLKQFKNMKKMFKKFKNIGSEKDLQKLQKGKGLEGLLGGMGKKKKKKFFR